MKTIFEYTHREKLLYPKDKITKGDVIDYYLAISPLFLKYVKGHPLTLQRWPQGIQKTGFFQKHAETIPDWIDRVTIPSKSKEDAVTYVLANKKNDLGYLANLNTLVFHQSLFTIKKLNYPAMLIWDLDPSDGSFEKVIDAAFKLKAFIDELGIQTYLKTTGSRGLHIQVPLNQRQPFETVHRFAKQVADILAERYPKVLTVEPFKKDRKKRVLIDHHRNHYSQTAVAAYSLRARPGAPLATPITWAELGKNVLASDQFTLRNIHTRLQKKGDIWQTEKIANPTIHQKMVKLNREFERRGVSY